MSKENIFKRVYKAIIGKQKETTSKVPATYDSQAVNYSNDFDRKKREYLAEMKGWVGACVNAIAEEVASINLKLYQYTSDGIKEVEDHAVLDLLYKVNGFTTKFEHFYLTQAYLELTGEAPWFIEKNGKEVLGVYILRPDKISPFSKDGVKIDGYKYEIGQGRTQILSADEVIFLKYPNPIKPYRGIGILEQAAVSVDIDNYSEKWNMNFYKNSARPDAILTVDVESMDEEQKAVLKKTLKDQYGGVKNAHNLMVLFGAMKFDKSSFSQKDMDFLEQQRFSRDKILGIFRVPKAIVSQTDEVNYASAKTAEYIFARYTIKPKMERLIQQLNEFLLPMYAGTEKMFLDFENVIPEDEEAKYKNYESGLKAGYLTINEVRREQELPDVDGGDVIYLPFNLVPLGESKSNDENEIGKGVKILKINKKKEIKLRKDLKSERLKELKARSKNYFEVEKIKEKYNNITGEIKKEVRDAIKGEYVNIDKNVKKKKKVKVSKNDIDKKVSELLNIANEGKIENEKIAKDEINKEKKLRKKQEEKFNKEKKELENKIKDKEVNVKKLEKNLDKYKGKELEDEKQKKIVSKLEEEKLNEISKLKKMRGYLEDKYKTDEKNK